MTLKRAMLRNMMGSMTGEENTAAMMNSMDKKNITVMRNLKDEKSTMKMKRNSSTDPSQTRLSQVPFDQDDEEND